MIHEVTPFQPFGSSYVAPHNDGNISNYSCNIISDPLQGIITIIYKIL